MTTERHADQHVTQAPDDGDAGQREEGRSRQSGRHMSAARIHGRGQRCGAHAKRERRQTDERRQRPPDNKEDADEVDVGIHTSEG